ncbi:type II secretion system F family protein [Acetivibrio clariflavus]|uniref:Flp pilus assembly protein TadC n=1 Tax=Acetivibrio clariflavus (strain DSM 19732 / NBRC 101661 / EBR45) TaxID=720554 RepID=G8LS91_ACECE|nr:type II secretion system F family protein [Acetivibrio clariflavus]AEV67152.1 Flp pilus assembly protein TadC [Acetivibrio clariflavus DSM 19732]
MSTLNIVIMTVGTVALLLWLIFFILGNKYDGMFDSLNEKDFPLKEIYGVGYAALETFRYSFNSKSDRKLKHEIEILYGDKYAEYFLRVIHAQKVTLSMTLFVISFVFYGLTNEIGVLLVMFMFSGLAFYYYGTLTHKKILKRSDEMLRDFTEVVSKLALLTNAGMILREAWETVAKGGNTTFYQEMQRSVDQMKNGVTEIDALYEFGVRCIIPEIKKLTSTLIQGLIKGNSELAAILQEQSKEVWDAKKQRVKRQGEKAASKLLIPMSIMFLGILIMIVVPIFANIGA